MSSRNHSPVLGWWVLACRALEALTAPRADTAACDRAVERLAGASRLGSTADRLGVTVRSAWRHSWSGAVVSRLAGRLTSLPPAAAIGVSGWTMAVAGGTILLLNAIKPVPVGPLSWVVPAGLVGAGVLLAAGAAPLAAARADRRFRRTAS